MHTTNKHTHKTGGSGMRTNGGNGRNGSMCHGVTREEGIGVPTGAWVAIFPTGSKQQENAKKKAEQKNSKKQHKKVGGKRNQPRTTDIYTL